MLQIAEGYLDAGRDQTDDGRPVTDLIEGMLPAGVDMTLESVQGEIARLLGLIQTEGMEIE